MEKTIDDIYWEIMQKMLKKHTWRETELAIAPLTWYIGTGRAPLGFERKLKVCTSRQLSTIANRLIKIECGDYNAAINSVCNYLGFKRYCEL